MCNFANFLFTNTGEIKVYNMASHAATAIHFNLKPQTYYKIYYEVEWLSNEPESLRIVALGADASKEIKECILSMYPTRQDFLNKYFTEEVQLRTVMWHSCIIKFIDNPSEKIQLAAVKQDGWSIQHINNPSEVVQLEAVRQDGRAINFIDNPSEAIQLAAIKQSGLVIASFDNPSEEMQLEAVKQDIRAIDFIDNPTQKVKEYVLSIQKLLEEV